MEANQHCTQTSDQLFLTPGTPSLGTTSPPWSPSPTPTLNSARPKRWARMTSSGWTLCTGVSQEASGWVQRLSLWVLLSIQIEENMCVCACLFVLRRTFVSNRRLKTWKRVRCKNLNRDVFEENLRQHRTDIKPSNTETFVCCSFLSCRGHKHGN